MEKKEQYTCDSCGGSLKIAEGGGRAVCPYCGRTFRLEERAKSAKGLQGVLNRLQERAEIVASNYGLSEARTASDSFVGDGREEERRLLSGAVVKNGVLVSYRSNGTGETVRVPDEIMAVGKRAAYKNASLSKVSFAPKVETVGKKAFARCGALVCVRLEGVRKLCSRAFAHCSALREVTISQYIPDIGKKVFHQCKRISRVILPRCMEPQISRLFGSFAKFRIEFIYFD